MELTRKHATRRSSTNIYRHAERSIFAAKRVVLTTDVKYVLDL